MRDRWELPTGITMAGTSRGPVDGRPLVLVHGLTNDADAWEDTAAELARILPDLRIIAIDLRGHGESDKPTDPAAYSATTMAADVLALMDVLGVARASVAGHSLGSLVAIELALDHPDRLDRLVLVSTTADARTTPILGDWLRHEVIDDRWLARLHERGLSDPEAAAATPLDADPDAVAWLQEFWNVYPLTPGRSTTTVAARAAGLPIATWLGCTDAILAFDRTADLARLAVPTLALWGTQDSFFRLGDQDSLVRSLRAAATAGGSFAWKQFGRAPLPADGLQADDLGHNLTWDAPVQVAADIAAFLTTGEPTGTEWWTNGPGESIHASSGTARVEHGSGTP